MANFTREREDRDWYRGLKVPASVIRNIDEKTKKAVSGSGGTWNPSSAIVLGGAGLELQCGLQLSGTATVAPAGDARFVFDDDDYFVIDGGVGAYTADSFLELMGGPSSIPFEVHGLEDYVPASDGAARQLITRRNGAMVRCPLKLPNGYVLAYVLVYFQVGTAHANVPAYMPRCRVVRIDASGVIEPVPGDTSNADADGWVSVARPATGADWYNSGNTQYHQHAFANAEPVDTSLYSYAVEWVDESGTNAFEDFNTGAAMLDVGTRLIQVGTTGTVSDLRPY